MADAPRHEIYLTSCHKSEGEKQLFALENVPMGLLWRIDSGKVLSMSHISFGPTLVLSTRSTHPRLLFIRSPDPPSRHHLPAKTGSAERRCLPAGGGQAIAPRFHGLRHKAQGIRLEENQDGIAFFLAPWAPSLAPHVSASVVAPRRLASNTFLVIRRTV
jgi:hypothetical protein